MASRDRLVVDPGRTAGDRGKVARRQVPRGGQIVDRVVLERDVFGVLPGSVRRPRPGNEAMTRRRSSKPGSVDADLASSWL
jgi:hypothetical protein